jgi:LPS sulfotransferase NodH
MGDKTMEEYIAGIFHDLESRPNLPVEKISRKIAIVSTPRCGSSMFCNLLNNTNRCGYPPEWFSPRFLSAYQSLFDIQKLDFDDYSSFIFKKTTSENGVFSVNFHVGQYTSMLKDMRVDPMKLGFNPVYFLRRRDKLALSLVKAQITDQWNSDTRAVKELPSNIPRSMVLSRLLFISRQEDFYESSLQKYVAHEYAYEDFKDLDTTDIFRQALMERGIPDPPGKWKTTLQIQAGDKNSAELNAIRNYLGC